MKSDSAKRFRYSADLTKCDPAIHFRQLWRFHAVQVHPDAAALAARLRQPPNVWLVGAALRVSNTQYLPRLLAGPVQRRSCQDSFALLVRVQIPRRYDAINHTTPASGTDIFSTALAPRLAQLRLIDTEPLCAHAQKADIA